MDIMEPYKEQQGLTQHNLNMLGLGNTITGGAALEDVAWDPSNLGSTLIAWYKNNTGLTNLSGTDGNSDNRLQWSDQSGNNNHIIQDDNADKPAIVSGALDFEVDDTDHMEFTSALDFGGSNPFTVFFVINRESYANQHGLLGSNTTEFIGFSSFDDKVKVRSGGSGGDNITMEFATDDLWELSTDFIFTLTKDASGNLLVYKDGAFQAEKGGGTSVNNGAAFDIEYVGVKQPNNANFDGLMKEILICDTVLSSSDRGEVITYLKNKFSIS